MPAPEKNPQRINQISWAAPFRVSNQFEIGFWEKVYENALAHEIRKTGLKVHQQYPIRILYDGIVVGDYVAELLIEECVLIELKAVQKLDNIHVAQLCLLLNFYHPRVETKRIVHNFPEKFEVSTPIARREQNTS